MNLDFELGSYQTLVNSARGSLADVDVLLLDLMDELHSMARGLDVERAEHAREVGVLTAERDNALPRIEELSSELLDADQRLGAALVRVEELERLNGDLNEMTVKRMISGRFLNPDTGQLEDRDA